QVTGSYGRRGQGASLRLGALLRAENDLAAFLQGFQRLDPAQKVCEHRRHPRRRPTRGLRVRHPVEVFQIQPENGCDWPGCLRQVDETVEREWSEELARELLSVGGRQADRGSVGAAEAELRQHRGVTARRCTGRHEERRELKALRELELCRHAGDGEATWRVAVSETHD